MIRSALILAALSALAGAPTAKAEDIEARWRREYPRAAAELERNGQNFLATGTNSTRLLFSHGQTLTTELTVASSGDKRLMIHHLKKNKSSSPRKGSATSSVSCKTPEYVFELRKEAPADPYVITFYADKFPNDLSFDFDFNTLARIATVYMQETLLQRMQSPSFHVKAAESLQEGGSELVRIEYSCDRGTVSESGSVYLDPQRNWVIRKVDIISSSQSAPHLEVKIDVDYEQVGDSVFLPKRREFFAKTPYPDIYQHDLFEMDRIAFADVPDEIFKLSAYGLPDVPLRPVRESSVFSLQNPLFWGSLFTAIVSFALLKVTRRRAVTAATATSPWGLLP